MKLKRRIQRSNAFIVLTSLVILFIIISLSVTFLGRLMFDNIEKDEIVDSKIFEAKRIIDQGDIKHYQEVKENLATLGYDLVVVQDQKVIYSSYDKIPRALDEFFIDDQGQEVYGIFHKENWSVLRKRLDEHDKFYAIYGENLDGFKNISWSQGFAYFKNLLLIGTLSILVLMGISYYFTRKMVKRVMTPVHLLMAGVKRVENNDLSQNIYYEGEEEFETLCHHFNKMQATLLEEMNKNTAFDKARADMIAGISHDLRTPLTSIRGFLQGMKDGVANTKEKQAKYVEICFRKANEMDRLLGHLNYYSKIETKALPFHFEPVDLSQMIKQLVTSSQEDQAENLEIFYEMPQKPMVCQIDPDQFYRVFMNIVENSLKYARVPRLKIKVRLFERDQCYCIEIKDNGLGVAERKLASVFQKFYRGDEYRNSQIEGSGLGLYLSSEIIKGHQGHIKAENDKGFKVTIALPKRKEI